MPILPPSTSALCPSTTTTPSSVTLIRCHECQYLTYHSHHFVHCKNCGHQIFGCTTRYIPAHGLCCTQIVYFAYKRCWACEADTESTYSQCRQCTMTHDGSAIVIWKASEGDTRREVHIEVDMDKTKSTWRRSNNQLVKPVRVCGDCGKECKGIAGWKVHQRKCNSLSRR